MSDKAHRVTRWRLVDATVSAAALLVLALVLVQLDRRVREIESRLAGDQVRVDSEQSASIDDPGDPIECGESLCPACSTYIVCYDGGRCPVSGDVHPMTLCSIEHEVK